MKDTSADADTKAWIARAMPILRKIRKRFDAMKWRERGPAPDRSAFETDLKALVGDLPRLPEVVRRSAITACLDETFNRTVHHGVPIPDDFHYSAIFPEPGTIFGESGVLEACLRIGVFVKMDEREGYGDLSKGVLIEPELKFADDP